MPTVLIIDDNAAVAIALDVLFSLHEIDAVRAASPEEGLHLLERRALGLGDRARRCDGADRGQGDAPDHGFL